MAKNAAFILHEIVNKTLKVATLYSFSGNNYFLAVWLHSGRTFRVCHALLTIFDRQDLGKTTVGV